MWYRGAYRAVLNRVRSAGSGVTHRAHFRRERLGAKAGAGGRYGILVSRGGGEREGGVGIVPRSWSVSQSAVAHHHATLGVGWAGGGSAPVTTQGRDRSQGTLTACDTWHRLRLYRSHPLSSQLLPLSQRQLPAGPSHHIMVRVPNNHRGLYRVMTGSGEGEDGSCSSLVTCTAPSGEGPTLAPSHVQTSCPTASANDWLSIHHLSIPGND